MLSLQLSKRVSQSLLKTPIKTLTTLTSPSSHLLSNLLSSPHCYNTTNTITTTTTTTAAVTANHGTDTCLLHSTPWAATQLRGIRVNASHVRPGNVIEKSGKIYQVVDAEHKQRGRGGAMMHMELRDVDSGNKVTLRFGTEEAVERVFVEEKSFKCLYTERDQAFLIEPHTFEQIEVPLELFGKAAAYLKDEMQVRLQLYDERPLSGSVPKRVTCTIKETQTPMKGISATPRYKRALLDNGLTIQVPPYLEPGEEIFINTEDDSFISRANK